CSYRQLSVFVVVFFSCSVDHRDLHSFPTRRSSDLAFGAEARQNRFDFQRHHALRRFISMLSITYGTLALQGRAFAMRHEDVLLRSEEHTSELQSRENLVCRLLLEKKKKKKKRHRKS